MLPAACLKRIGPDSRILCERDDSAERGGVGRAAWGAAAGNGWRASPTLALVQRPWCAYAGGCGEGGVVVPGAGPGADFRFLFPAGAGVVGVERHRLRHLCY